MTILKLPTFLKSSVGYQSPTLPQQYPAVLPEPTNIIEELYSLSVTQKITSTKIIMQMHYNQLNTRDVPQIVPLLQEHLPNVLLTQCFNDEGKPFCEEVKHTETGHLFEHILLEYLCQLKIAKGAYSASYSGRTKWNWVKETRGKFNIYLTCGAKDADILPLALQKTIKLMNLVLGHHQSPLFLSKPLFGPRNGLKNGKRSRIKK